MLGYWSDVKSFKFCVGTLISTTTNQLKFNFAKRNHNLKKSKNVHTYVFEKHLETQELALQRQG